MFFLLGAPMSEENDTLWLFLMVNDVTADLVKRSGENMFEYFKGDNS